MGLSLKPPVRLSSASEHHLQQILLDGWGHYFDCVADGLRYCLGGEVDALRHWCDSVVEGNRTKS